MMIHVKEANLTILFAKDEKYLKDEKPSMFEMFQFHT